MIGFGGWIEEWRVIEGVEYTVRWAGNKNGLFFVMSMYKVLEQRTLFSLEVHFENLCAVKDVFLCLGVFLGKDFNLQSVVEKRVCACQLLFPFSRDPRDGEPSPSSLPRNNGVVGFAFLLFGVSWVMSASVRESLLGWKVPLLLRTSEECVKWDLLDNVEGLC